MGDTEREPKIGDRVQIKEMSKLWYCRHTFKWMAGYYGTIIRLNPTSVTVRFDAYPDEKHYVDYDHFYYCDEEV